MDLFQYPAFALVCRQFVDKSSQVRHCRIGLGVRFGILPASIIRCSYFSGQGFRPLQIAGLWRAFSQVIDAPVPGDPVQPCPQGLRCMQGG